ncbi:MAG TPA: hypothetical protein VL860_01935, partial [Planctomycetota bacterium]|nr:hypothetical protein [Planctomycetota bacterium]
STEFAAAVTAEGGTCGAYTGNASLLNIHPLFRTADIYHEGHPTARPQADRALADPAAGYPHAMNFAATCLLIPSFKHDNRTIIEQHAHAYRKVAEYHATHRKA